MPADRPPDSSPAQSPDKASAPTDRPGSRLPGILLCAGIGLSAAGLHAVEERLFGQAWLEPLVLAILIGMTVRVAWTPGPRWTPGLTVSAKFLLEVSVLLLGASISPDTVRIAGPSLLAGIAGVVILALAVSYGIGRAFGLTPRMAALVACGNSICGNSAITAAAPAVGADGADVAAAVAFTAVLGALVVLGLPGFVSLLDLSEMQYGVLAGLMVYAVPQILPATVPVGLLSVQIGTLVKLTRVLMLGPVLLVLALITKTAGRSTVQPLPVRRFVPWYIIGFMALIAIRSVGLLPDPAPVALETTAKALTMLSMAALGLGVDLRLVLRSGPRVTVAVLLSLIAIGGISMGMILVLAVA